MSTPRRKWPNGLVYQFGQVGVWDCGTVVTPVGQAPLSETAFSYQGSVVVIYRVTRSRFLLPVILLLVLPTLGLSLLLLLILNTHQQVVLDTVEVQAPQFTYLAQGEGGQAFASAAQTWGQQIRQYETRNRQILTEQQHDRQILAGRLIEIGQNWNQK